MTINNYLDETKYLLSIYLTKNLYPKLQKSFLEGLKGISEIENKTINETTIPKIINALINLSVYKSDDPIVRKHVVYDICFFSNYIQ